MGEADEPVSGDVQLPAQGSLKSLDVRPGRSATALPPIGRTKSVERDEEAGERLSSSQFLNVNPNAKGSRTDTLRRRKSKKDGIEVGSPLSPPSPLTSFCRPQKSL